MNKTEAMEALGITSKGQRAEVEENPRALLTYYVEALGAAHPELTDRPVDTPWEDIVQAGVVLDIQPAMGNEAVAVHLVRLAVVHGLGHIVCSLLPRFIPAEHLAQIEALGIEEALREARDLLETASEKGDDARAGGYRRLWIWLSREPVEVMLRASKWSSAGRQVLGKASKISPVERDRMIGDVADRPTHRVTLSLPAWLEMGPEQRARLMLHELLHFAPDHLTDGRWRVSMVAHDIEEFALTLRLFGAAEQLQAEAVIAGASHPELSARVRTWEPYLDERGQSLLFQPVPR